MTLQEFLHIYDISINANEEVDKVASFERPVFVGEKKTPESLNKLSFGDLIELQNIAEDYDLLTKPCMVVLDMDKAEVMGADIKEVISFSIWVSKEIERINDLFLSTNVPPTPQEKQAGIERLQFGVFGTIDWYARRMGIDHDDVEKVPWIRIYKCLDMRSKEIVFERRFNNLISKRK